MVVGLRERANYIGIGKEGTWGTSVARTDFLETREADFSHVPSYGYRGGFRSASRLGRFKIKDLAEGVISADLLYEGFEKHFENVFGSGSGATTGSATLGYTHTFDGKDPIPNGLTVEVDKDVGVYIAKGSEFSRMRIAMDARSEFPVLCEFGLVAREMIISAGGIDAPTTPTYPSPLEPVLANECISVDFDFGGVVEMVSKIVSAEIILDNQYDNDRRSLGSTNILQPTRTGPRLVSASLVAEFHDDADFVAKAKSGQLGTVNFDLVSPNDIPGTSPLVKYATSITINDAFITAAPVPVTGFGRMLVQVTIEGVEDPTASPLTALRIAYKNGASSI